MNILSKLVEEPQNKNLIVITGPMFAGKTTKILNLYNQYNPNNTLVFNHTFDNRYADNNNVISTHNKDKINCIKFKNVNDIKLYCLDKFNNNMIIKNIIIDECQFFKDIDILTNKLFNILPNIENIVCAGLDFDAKGNMFNLCFQNLIDNCNILYKLKAQCHICKLPAKYTSCLVSNTLDKNNVLVGSKETYQPSCYKHFVV